MVVIIGLSLRELLAESRVWREVILSMRAHMIHSFHWHVCEGLVDEWWVLLVSVTVNSSSHRVDLRLPCLWSYLWEFVDFRYLRVPPLRKFVVILEHLLRILILSEWLHLVVRECRLLFMLNHEWYGQPQIFLIWPSHLLVHCWSCPGAHIGLNIKWSVCVSCLRTVLQLRPWKHFLASFVTAIAAKTWGFTAFLSRCRALSIVPTELWPLFFLGYRSHVAELCWIWLEGFMAE